MKLSRKSIRSLYARNERRRLGFFPKLYRNVTIKVKAFKLCLPINARRLANTANGSWGMLSSPTYEANAAKTRKYPQRQLGDHSGST